MLKQSRKIRANRLLGKIETLGFKDFDRFTRYRKYINALQAIVWGE